MEATALLLLVPTMNTPAFLSLSNEMLGYSPGRAADAVGLKNQQHLLACLASFRNKTAGTTVKAAKDMFDLVSYGCLFAADEIDMAYLLETLGGMPFAVVETRVRGVQSAIASGTLREWKTAVMRGCRQDQPQYVRRTFGKIYTQFCTIGLAEAFPVKNKKSLPDQTFSLEE